jgi:protein-glutamine gamma-glutamyltransferase
MPASFRRCLVLLVLGAAFGPSLRAEELARPQIGAKDIDFRTDWYGIYLKERKIGYARTARTKLPDGTISEVQLTKLKLVSFGQKAELQLEQTFVYEAAVPYALLRGELLSADGTLKLKKILTRAAPGYEVVHEGIGVRQKQALPNLVYGLSDALAQEMWIRKGPKANDKISFTNLDLTDQDVKIDVQTCKLLGSKTSLAAGVQTRVYEVENTWRDKNLKSLSRLDETGLILSDQLAVFELRLEPEEQAKNTEFSQDLFVMGMAKVSGPLGNPRQVRALVLEVKGDENGFGAGPRQAVTVNADGTRLLKVGKAFGKPVPVSAKEAQEHLAETATYPISSARIQQLARQAVGDAQEPAEKLRRVLKFTHDYIKPSLSASLPQVHDLLDTKKGDCKSYALLFTNLARAAGIPAREVSGLLYVGDDYKAFGGHAWNEVVLDGVWVPVDASLNETEVNATHLSFGSEQRAIANLLNSLGKLSFRLVEVQHAP